MVSSGTKGCDLSSGSVGSGLEVQSSAMGSTKGCDLNSGSAGSGLEVQSGALGSTKGCNQSNIGIGVAGSSNEQAHHPMSVATDKYFDPKQMILAECQSVNLASLTGVERARYWHRTLGDVNMKRLQSMSAQGKVDGIHQLSNPHEDFGATLEGKWRRDPIVRSKINNKLQMK